MDTKDDRPARRPRRLTLFDMMALVSATALGLAGARAVFPTLAPPATGRAAWAFDGPLSLMVAAWSLALVGLGAAHSRPSWRRVARRPGWVACSAALAAIALGLVSHLAFGAIHVNFLESPGTVDEYWVAGVALAPAFVGGAWAALWLSGRWSGEATWIDRAGRSLGLFWLLSLARDLLGPALVALFPTL